jgi:hypothetical protein
VRPRHRFYHLIASSSWCLESEPRSPRNKCLCAMRCYPNSYIFIGSTVTYYTINNQPLDPCCLTYPTLCTAVVDVRDKKNGRAKKTISALVATRPRSPSELQVAAVRMVGSPSGPSAKHNGQISFTRCPNSSNDVLNPTPFL